MTQTSEEVIREDCGCSETVTRDVSGKVTKQDMNHCIAHALEWAGSFLTHVGRRLLVEAMPKKPEQKFSATYGDNLGKLLWAEEEYAHPVPFKEGEALLHEFEGQVKGYRVTKAVTIGLRHVFTVEEVDPSEATVVTDAVTDHLKKHGFEEPKTDEISG